MMDNILATKLWKRTLGSTGGGQTASQFRRRLRGAFESFRNRAEELANQISHDIRQLTVHDIRHIDALWETADTIIGGEYPITPTEGFVLGGAFLLHDLGLALASYPDGADELRMDNAWQDAVAAILRKKLGRAASTDELADPSADIVQLATEQVLRLRHAKRGEDLALIGFQHKCDDPIYYLLEDIDLRETYGRLIGRIAYSHWWSVEDIVADNELNRHVGAFPHGPTSWSIHPLKLAIILRATDACHLDARRAPGFLRALRKPTGVAELHWRIQAYLQKATTLKNRIVFTSTRPVPIEDREAWWVGYDLLQLADKELRDSEVVLSALELPPFAVHGVTGCASPTHLSKHIPTIGWIPVDTSVRATDVGSLVKKIGGEGLYGRNPTVPLRELIQNARDAVVGRRIKTERGPSWGTITVRLSCKDDIDILEVDDNGLGMSQQLLSGPLLDFGTSYWESHLASSEHPGLLARGFEPQGTFGIGFFSVFMLADRVKVVTRRPEDAIQETRVLEFERGLSARPVIRGALIDERREDAGTCVTLWLRENAHRDNGLLTPRDYTSEVLDDPNSRRETAWPLGELCQWLCPALDVDLAVETEGNLETIVHASDWETIEAKQLLHRLMLNRKDVVEILTSGVLDVLADNMRAIRDPKGNVIGRAALVDPVFAYRGPNGDYFRPPGVRTAGCFRAFAWMGYPGVLVGRPAVAARTTSWPVAFDYRKELAAWATEQATLVRAFSDDPVTLARYAGLVRVLNGDTGSLPIAEYLGRAVSFRDIVGMDLPCQLELFEAFWGVHEFRPMPAAYAENAVGISSGRMKSMYDGPLPDVDFRERANHPRWRQYWMSLWGATIEAIAAAWGCRLQDVLAVSEIHAVGREENEEDGRIVMRSLRDIVRRPTS